MDRVASYAAYLTLQAQVSFGQEIGLFYIPDFQEADTIVDAG